MLLLLWAGAQLALFIWIVRGNARMNAEAAAAAREEDEKQEELTREVRKAVILEEARMAVRNRSCAQAPVVPVQAPSPGEELASACALEEM